MAAIVAISVSACGETASQPSYAGERRSSVPADTVWITRVDSDVRDEYRWHVEMGPGVNAMLFGFHPAVGGPSVPQESVPGQTSFDIAYSERRTTGVGLLRDIRLVGGDRAAQAVLELVPEFEQSSVSHYYFRDFWYADTGMLAAMHVLAALGVNIDADMRLIERSIAEAGIGFMMAPRHHGAMKHVGPVRVELGVRTIFNLLGPLSNPAGTRFQVIGVYDRKWVTPLAQVCRDLGAQRVWIVHGADGLDELSTTASTYVAELKDGAVHNFEVTPEDAGLPRSPRRLRHKAKSAVKRGGALHVGVELGDQFEQGFFRGVAGQHMNLGGNAEI